jgi:hypothetical protein
MYRINGVSANTNSCCKSKNCKVRCGSHLMARSCRCNAGGVRLIFCDEGPPVNCALVWSLLELNVVGLQTMLSFEFCASFCVESVAGDLRTMDDAAQFKRRRCAPHSALLAGALTAGSKQRSVRY